MLRIAFLGMGQIAASCFDAIMDTNHQVVGVLSHRRETNEENDELINKVLRRNIPLCLSPARSKEAMTFVRQLHPDLLVSVHYRYIVPGEVLSLASEGGINVHGSLLPKYRGRSPNVWAIINGEAKTGISVHYMEEEVDAGDIILQEEFPITMHETAGSLMGKYKEKCPLLLVEAIRRVADEQVSRVPQDHAAASFYGKRSPEDGRIDWNSSSKQIYNCVRAMTHPYPGAFTYVRGRRLFVWEVALMKGTVGGPDTAGRIEGELIAVKRENCGLLVATADGYVILQRVQFAGESETNAIDLILEGKLRVGELLG